MKKIILVFILLFSFISVQALEINSKNAIMYNLNDNTIIFEKNSEEKVQIASLTKIVTAITVFNNVYDLNKQVIIEPKMLYGLEGYAALGLRIGDKLTYLDLLYALMLPSAADAAQALAIDISGSITDFSELMNKEIQKIGVTNSHFDNPVGMDSKNNYSTASDMAKILMYSLENETFKTIFNSFEYKIESLNKVVKKTTSSYNVDTSIINGAKTGFTYGAGMCLASNSLIEDVNYLLVTLGAQVGTYNHAVDTINIYNYYSNNYGYINLLTENQLLHTIKVKDSKTKEYSIFSDKDVKLYLQKNIKDNLQYKYIGIEELSRKIKKGDKLGIINIMSGEDILHTYDVYLNADISYYNYYLYFGILISLLILSIVIIVLKRKKSLIKKGI